MHINAIFAKPKPLHMSEKNEKDFQSATQCWIYQKEFNDEANPKVEVKSRKENPQKLTQLSSRSHPRHLVGKRTAQKTPS